MKKNRGLFLSHLDEKSGAPKALYNILKFILLNFELKVDVLNCQPRNSGFFENLKREPNIKNVPTISYLKCEKKSKFALLQKIKNNLLKIGSSNLNKRIVQEFNKKYDFIFFNSVSFQSFRSELDILTIDKFLYLHEGSVFLDEFLRNEYSVFEKFKHIFVPSEQVQKNLIAHNIPSTKISVLQLFLDTNEILKAPKIMFPKSDFVVGNLANLLPGKSIEYFLAAAKLYKESHPTDKIIFKWKGAVLDSYRLKLAQFEIEKANLKDVVFLEEYSANTDDFFSSIDLLMMTSKQETFGYVVLEAANNCKPAIAFDEVIGAADFIKEYGGIVVDYLSIAQLVSAIKIYYDNQNLLFTHGMAANNLMKLKYCFNDLLKSKLKSTLSIVLPE